MSEKKIYVLDTNIILDNPDCITDSFEENDLVVPLVVLEELDNQKKINGEVGVCARRALRIIDSLIDGNNLTEGSKRNENGDLIKIEILTSEDISRWETLGFNVQKNDDLIILTALKTRDKNEDKKCVLISNDNSVRIKSSLLDIPAQHYKEGTVKKESLEYKGFMTVTLPDSFFGEVDEASGEFIPKRIPNKIEFSQIEEYMEEDITENEFVNIIPSEENLSKAIRKKLKSVYKYNDGLLVKKTFQHKGVYGGVSGKNLEQSAALDLLLDNDVSVVALNGLSGSGKTILSIASSVTLMSEKASDYDKLILLKPTVSVSDDIGFLPGNVEEKLSHYMGSYMDNFKMLKKLELENNGSTGNSYDDLKEKEKIEIESISFLRGRSLNNCIIVVDEVQNLTQNVIKTILTRVGSNCKIILLGDPEQIDRPFLSKYNNGLSYLIEKFRGQSFFGHVKFVHGVRSEVSKIASELL
jgi:PhoH-like ATPase